MNTEQLLLTVNAGSSSLKLAVFRVGADSNADSAEKPVELLRILLDRHGDEPATVSGNEVLRAAFKTPSVREFPAFTCAIVDQIPVDVIAHRVVHGGDECRECVRIDAKEIVRLHALSPLAPLHQPPALAIIGAIAAAQPALPQFACFDTAFHTTMPAVARDYALPADIHARYPEIRAWGFHGLSCRSVVDQLRTAGELPQRLVIAHLGSGASVTAVRDGYSIATSMGFSALDGVPMATRPGHLDPGVLLHLLRHENPDVDALEDMLYRHSGLLGLSGISGDMRVLMASEDPRAKSAVDFFVYHVAAEIGALSVALGGMDSIVFTGGVGEHQPVICERVAEKLRWMNASLVVRSMACNEEAVMATAASRMD